jgi:predicted RNA binding protein YcfA (HicA-like mRNA interferase family)
MTANEIIKQLTADGWMIVRQKGSHIQLKKEGIQKLITVPNHGSRELSIGVVQSIKKIAGFK